jgi:hypothetical protein
MAVMLSRTYDAFIAAGSPEEKARADLAAMKWMLGLVIAGVGSLVIKAFA